jgi:hypothetical protein
MGLSSGISKKAAKARRMEKLAKKQIEAEVKEMMSENEESDDGEVVAGGDADGAGGAGGDGGVAGGGAGGAEPSEENEDDEYVPKESNSPHY